MRPGRPGEEAMGHRAPPKKLRELLLRTGGPDDSRSLLLMVIYPIVPIIWYYYPTAFTTQQIYQLISTQQDYRLATNLIDTRHTFVAATLPATLSLKEHDFIPTSKGLFLDPSF
jgi:hypothetical protein